MSIYWTARRTTALVLFTLVFVARRLLEDRDAHSERLENTAAAVGFVAAYNACCFLIVGIPSDPLSITGLNFSSEPATVAGLRVLGFAMLAVGAYCIASTIRQRRVVGGQDTKQGLITSGLYGFSRHPIYLGIVLVSFAIVLIASNVYGLRAFPLVLAANAWQASVEERLDIGVRFGEEYARYRRKTWMFGPPAFWTLPAAAAGFAVLA